VFLDETGASTMMTRCYSRAARGRRLIAKVPHSHWKTEAIVVDYSCARPMLRVAAEAEMGDTHRILPMVPEFAQLLETALRG
jgi:hypothetical protein